MHLKHARIPIPPRPQTYFIINRKATLKFLCAKNYLFAGAVSVTFPFVLPFAGAVLVAVLLATLAFTLAFTSTLALLLASGASAGAVSVGSALVVCKTETLPVNAGIAKSNAETIKTVAPIIVSFDRIVVAPRG